jgi:hypothetical protein
MKLFKFIFLIAERELRAITTFSHSRFSAPPIHAAQSHPARASRRKRMWKLCNGCLPQPLSDTKIRAFSLLIGHEASAEGSDINFVKKGKV